MLELPIGLEFHWKRSAPSACLAGLFSESVLNVANKDRLVQQRILRQPTLKASSPESYVYIFYHRINYY